jgi:hypothetical protein
VTFVGALGNEYVFACADGTSNETSSDVARAREPRLKILRDERVLFIGASYLYKDFALHVFRLRHGCEKVKS